MATYYIDFGATYDGDGTAYTQAAGAGQTGAYNTYVGKTFASGDIVWIRRSDTALGVTANYTGALGNVKLYGWPYASTDDHYAIRPADPRTTWDADSAEYAKVSCGTTPRSFAPTGNDITLRRLWFDTTMTGSNNTLLMSIAGNSLDLRYCKATHSSIAVGSAVYAYALSSTGTNPKIQDAHFRGSVTTGGSSPYIVCNVNSGASPGLVRNITVDIPCSQLQNGSGVTHFGNTAGNKPLVVENLTINFLDPNPTIANAVALVQPSGDVRFNDVTVTNAYSGSVYQGPSLVFGGVSTRVTNCRMSGAGAAGPVYTAIPSFIEVKNWNVLYPMTGSNPGTPYTAGTINPVTLNNGAGKSRVIVTNGTLNTSSAAVAPVYLYNSSSELLLDNVDVVDANFLVARLNDRVLYDLFSINHDKVAGAWHYENGTGRIDTSSAYRTGGASYSLKGAGKDTALAQNARMSIVSQPGRETYFVDLASGSNTVTMYGAHVGWAGTLKAAPDTFDVGFFFDYWNGDGDFSTCSTASGAALTSDDSTWNDDTGFTVFKVAVTVTTNGAQTVPFHIFLSPEYDSAGYVYVDPQIVVT